MMQSSRRTSEGLNENICRTVTDGLDTISRNIKEKYRLW